MDIQKKDSSRVLEPDLIVSGDKVVHMSEDEAERLAVEVCGEVLQFLFRRHLGGF